ncbi:MAG: PorT family protein [Bacteroidia bacterium]|nr:PorT family protein [Bacteroidia bacterium]MDW8347972.1 outer membrane beta-barrel protein [Bacteroidia bacterium]
MIKKIILAAFALLFAAPTTQAQIKGGVFFDLGSSWFRYSGTAGRENKGTTGRLSFGGGIRVEYALGDMFSLTGGLGYKTYGANGKNYKQIDLPNQQTTTNADKYQYKLGYLILPIGVKANITELTDGLTLNGSVGIQPMILMGGKSDYTGGNIQINSSEYTPNAYGWKGLKSSNWAQPFDFGVNMGLGTDFYIDGVGTVQGQLLMNINFIKIEQRNIKQIPSKITDSGTGITTTQPRDYKMGEGQDKNFINNNDTKPQNSNMFFGLQLGFLLGSKE